ncbi:MAG: DUF1684 domain-containing protein [Acidobacteriota bacterium]
MTVNATNHLPVPSFRLPALLLLMLITAAACRGRPPEDPKDYVATILAGRAAKDNNFRNGSDSPVPPNRRAELLPLGYFPVGEEYKTGASLTPTNDTAVIQVATSTGTVRKMRRVGALEFTLKGQPLKLTAFVEVGAPNVDHLFVPFNDLTSGTESYPGGRYLDLDRNSTGIYEVDFNRAYFPYCFYSPTYECPYPPAENRLKVPIRAGERFKMQS